MKNQATFLQKPRYLAPCNGCGYCCTTIPCDLAQEYLNCEEGPCIALEHADGRYACGLVRNPLGYIYSAVHADRGEPVHDYTQLNESKDLSAKLAQALGIGLGCDAVDTPDSARWPTQVTKSKR